MATLLQSNGRNDEERQEENAKGSKTAPYSFKQEKTKNGTEITLAFGKDIIKFNFEDYDIELEDKIYTFYRQSEKALNWCSIEQVIGIFEKLVVFLYNGAVALGHIKFQQEIKTLIKELVTAYEKGITMMQQYKAKFCSVLKGEGKLEYRQYMYHIFYEGFEHLSNIYVQISDAHEKLTDLQKALDEADKLEQYNDLIIENLQATVNCCIEAIELLCECGRKFLRKQLEKSAVQKDKKSNTSNSEEISMDIEDIAYAFVVIERCQMLIEISEHTIHNIKEEIHKTITVNAAKITVRKIMSSIPALISLFKYHHEQFGKMRVFNYI